MDDTEQTNEFLRSVIARCNAAIESTDEDERLDAIEDAEIDIRRALDSYWDEVTE